MEVVVAEVVTLTLALKASAAEGPVVVVAARVDTAQSVSDRPMVATVSAATAPVRGPNFPNKIVTVSHSEQTHSSFCSNILLVRGVMCAHPTFKFFYLSGSVSSKLRTTQTPRKAPIVRLFWERSRCVLPKEGTIHGLTALFLIPKKIDAKKEGQGVCVSSPNPYVY